jgi:hypothetical protein
VKRCPYCDETLDLLGVRVHRERFTVALFARCPTCRRQFFTALQGEPVDGEPLGVELGHLYSTAGASFGAFVDPFKGTA